ELRLLGPEADVVATAVGEQVGRRAVYELVALAGHLREEGRHDALAHHAPGNGYLLEEDVLDPLALDAVGDLGDALDAARLVARLLERRRRGLRRRRGEHRLHRPAQRRLVSGYPLVGGGRHASPPLRLAGSIEGKPYTDEQIGTSGSPGLVGGITVTV